MSRIWDDYVTRRFKAHSNLLKILAYQGIDIGDPEFYPKTIQEFRRNWGERINIGERMGVFEKDSRPVSCVLNDGHRIMIMFVSVKDDKLKIPKITIQSYLSVFLQSMIGLTGEQAFTQTELIKDIECILISAMPLDGTAKNEIVRFNSILQFPIRHFTVEELQYDPTTHATGPRKARVLTLVEVDEYIARQRGLLLNGKNRIVPSFEDNLAEKKSEAEKIEFVRTTNAQILSQIPTINTNDPWVKWRGFKVGEVVLFTRRVGRTKKTYRRVIQVEPAESKPPKVKITTTNK